MMCNDFGQYSPLDSPELLHFALKWTPRMIVVGLAGYYSLGFAYDQGIMAAIDRQAIRILRHSMGYVGVGAFMPTFQWYSAWGVRITAAMGAALIYDLVEKITRSIFALFPAHFAEEAPLTPVPFDVSPQHQDRQ